MHYGIEFIYKNFTNVSGLIFTTEKGAIAFAEDSMNKMRKERPELERKYRILKLFVINE